MTAEIISVGTELLLGNILNTNAQYLSRELAALGITVRRQSTIGDNHGRLAEFVNEAKQRCDLLVFTGGLGPTADDLTKETVAACFGDTLTFDPDEWQKIVDFFTRTGRETTPNNRKQAMVPVHGHKVVNHHGTAPGAWFEQDGRCAVLMPGVPHEMKAMWEESVRPLLLARQSCALHSLTLRVLGGESNLEYRVRALLENQNPTAAIYCKTGECEIRITARAQNDAEAQTMCRAYAKKFYDLLGDAVYDEDVAGLEETVVHTLQANGLTIATAESCTGGMIAQRLTSVSGASEVFGYGFVTYWEQAKAKLVGVDPAVIAQYNVVSAPVAAQMALGAAKAAGADIAVSVTGLAGPGGGDAVRPVGTVYLGAARGDKVYVKKLFVSRPDRALIRARAAQTALELALLGDAVYDEDVAGLEETVVHTLQANGLTIATAESCTGGMIAQRLTSVSGASEVFGYGFVTYWEQAKAKLVGVDPAVIAQYNVVSAPVAAQMALGAAKAAGADIAVSVTGLAGPGGGDAVRPVGTVYLGAARGDKVYVKKLFVSRPDRALIRARAAQTALELALRLAQGKTPAGTQVLAESAQHDPAALTALDETLRAE